MISVRLACAARQRRIPRLPRRLPRYGYRVARTAGNGSCCCCRNNNAIPSGLQFRSRKRPDHARPLQFTAVNETTAKKLRRVANGGGSTYEQLSADISAENDLGRSGRGRPRTSLLRRICDPELRCSRTNRNPRRPQSSPEPDAHRVHQLALCTRRKNSVVRYRPLQCQLTWPTFLSRVLPVQSFLGRLTTRWSRPGQPGLAISCDTSLGLAGRLISRPLGRFGPFRGRGRRS